MKLLPLSWLATNEWKELETIHETTGRVSGEGQVLIRPFSFRLCISTLCVKKARASYVPISAQRYLRSDRAVLHCPLLEMCSVQQNPTRLAVYEYSRRIRKLALATSAFPPREHYEHWV